MPKIKKNKRINKHRRVRSKISGTSSRPRLSVYRSNKHLFLQLIDDKRGATLISASDKEIKTKKGTKSDLARESGLLIAKKAAGAGIKNIVFDRGGYRYHGRIQKVADGAREGGLNF